MQALRRLIAVALLCLVVAAAGAFATGWLTHVATTGVSMEPTYSAGDLVIIGRDAPYEVDDIVAYRIPGNDTLVLHRIVGGDDTGFTIQGDNNESIDPYRPAADEILGRELLHVPRIGALLTSPLVRGALLFSVLALLGVMTVKKSDPSAVATSAAPAERRRGLGRLAWKLLLVVDVVLLIAAGVVQLISSSEPDRPDVTAPTQTAELSYEAEVGDSATYPDGELVTGDPVFTALADRIEVVFRHTTDAPEAVSGTASIDVEVSTPSGWTRTRELVPPTRFGTNDSQLRGILALPQIRALVDRVAKETGVPAQTVTIVVRAGGEASLAGAAAEPFDVEMTMQLDATSLILTTETEDSPSGPVIATTSPLAPVQDADQPDQPTRELLMPLLVVLLATAALTVVLWPTPNDTEEAVSEMADAATVRLSTTMARIELSDRKSLEAIATKVGRPVLMAEGWEGVLTAEALYWLQTEETASESALPKSATGAPATYDEATERLVDTHR